MGCWHGPPGWKPAYGQWALAEIGVFCPISCRRGGNLGTTYRPGLEPRMGKQILGQVVELDTSGVPWQSSLKGSRRSSHDLAIHSRSRTRRAHFEQQPSGESSETACVRQASRTGDADENFRALLDLRPRQLRAVDGVRRLAVEVASPQSVGSAMPKSALDEPRWNHQVPGLMSPMDALS